MRIKDLFEKDIQRPINGVVKADQMDDVSVWQELDEYVVTQEVNKHLSKFFSTYATAIDQGKDPAVDSQIGVWVSGFFGSGKSHFIKILSYILKNKVVKSGDQAKSALAFFEKKIDDALMFADIKKAVSTNADVILFNIDSKAEPKMGRDAILAVFLRVFNEALGFSGDHPHIAHMERYLQKKGTLETFHEAYHDLTGSSWIQERDVWEFNRDHVIEAMSKATDQSSETAARWVDYAESNFSLTVENFAQWVKEYLDTRGRDHRILFLVDEIGQFIGQESALMLNLQTIVENLGTICGGRAWVVVTSQEDIDSVLGEVRAKKANDFSKITGRFRTRLSLSSGNIDEVIQYRLLKKVDACKAELKTVFREKGDILRHQLSFHDAGMTFKSFKSETDFVSHYPFAPYQFQLVQKVLETIRKVGASGLHLSRGERSMLDAFQAAASSVVDREIGALIPLSAFYSSIESFLDTTVKRTIDQAAENPSLESFDIKLLQTLFLIRYVDEVKGNVENLTTLCIDEIDADRLAIREKIEASLQRLEKQTLVNRNGDDFFFLTNEERDIGREIKQVDVNSAEEARLMGEILFDEVLRGNRKYRFKKNQKDFSFNRLCDRHPIGSTRENDLSISIITPLGEEYDAFIEARCLTESQSGDGQVVIKLGDHKSLARELRVYLQTKNFVSRKNDAALAPRTKEILKSKSGENHQRRNRLVGFLDELLVEADYFAAGKALDMKAKTAGAAVEEALEYLVSNTFNKMGHISTPSKDPRKEMQAVLRSNDLDRLKMETEGLEGNALALQDIRNFVDLSRKANRQIILKEMVEDRYGKRPYGWPDREVLLMISRLIVLGEIKLIMDGGEIPVEKVFEALDSPSRWRKVTVDQRKTTNKKVLETARKLGKDLFAEMGPEKEPELFEFFQKRLKSRRAEYREWAMVTEVGYPGGSEIRKGLELIDRLLSSRESQEFFQGLIGAGVAVAEYAEGYSNVSHFFKNQKPAWERLIKAQSICKVNASELAEDSKAASALARMGEILEDPTPYSHLKDVDALIREVDGANRSIVQECREKALSEIDDSRNTIEQELERMGAGSQLRQSVLDGLDRIRREIVNEEGIAFIREQVRKSVSVMDEALERIEETQASRVDGTDASPGGNPGQPSPSPRKRRIVKPAALSTKPFLETQEDVDQYLKDLRDALEAALASGERIQIR